MIRPFLRLFLIPLIFGLIPTLSVALGNNGLWERPFDTLTVAQRREALAAINLYEEHGIEESQVLMDRQELPWRKGAYIYRSAAGWEPNNLLIYFLRQPDGKFIHLDGTSPPIHGFNKAFPPQLSNTSIGPYLWFFGFFVRGEEGPFLVVETDKDTFIPKNLEKHGGTWADGYDRLADVPAPLSCRKDADGSSYRCDAVLYYSNSMFGAGMKVLSTGIVQMQDDTPLAADIGTKIFAPITPAALGDRFKPKPPAANALEAVRPKIAADLFSALEALAEGRSFRLDTTNTPFLAGMATAMMERCAMPRNRVDRVKLGGFAASSAFGAMAGFDFSNPDLGAAIGSMGRQQTLLYSGVLVINTLGCSEGLNTLGENLVKVIAANSASGSGFVRTCRNRHNETKCTCMANVARQVIPDIAQRSYSSRLMQEVVQRNPFIGLMLVATCGMTDY